MSIGSRAGRALRWSWLQAVVGALLQLAITATLSRLLLPKHFGVVALSALGVRFLSYFSQMGFSAAIVQRDEVSVRELSELTTLATLVSCGFTLIAVAAGMVIAGSVGAVLQLMSVSFVLTGLSVVPYGVLRRGLLHRELAVAELLAQLFGTGGVAIALAAAGCGPWSIVGGLLAQQALVATAAWIAVRRSGTARALARPTEKARGYIGFGLRHSLNAFLEFVHYNIEVLVIGNSLGLDSVGYYNRAYSLTHLPVEQVTTSVVRVLFPVLSRVRDDADREQTAFMTAFVCCGLYASGFCGALFAAAPEIARVVFGPGWDATVPIMRVLAVIIPVRYLLNLQSAWLDARAVLRPRGVVAAICIAVKLALVTGALVYEVSLPTFVALACISDAVWQLVYVAIVPPSTSVARSRLLAALAVFAANACVVAAVVGGVSRLARASGWTVLPTFAVQVMLGGACVLCVVLLVVRSERLGLRRATVRDVPLLGRWVA